MEWMNRQWERGKMRGVGKFEGSGVGKEGVG